MTISVTVACGYMEIRSFLVYRTLSVAKRKDFKEDIRLLGSGLALQRIFWIRHSTSLYFAFRFDPLHPLFRSTF